MSTFNRSALTFAVGALVSFTHGTGWAQAPAEKAVVSPGEEDPSFEVSGFDVVGPELVPRLEVMSILAAYAGRTISFSELREATVKVERLHALAGYEVVRVLVPEQELAPGQNLKLQILDARLDVITVTGNNHFKAEQIQAALPVLKSGALINTVEMDKNLRLINDNPSKVVRVELEPSDKDGLVDAKVKVLDQNPLNVFTTLDNSGTNATGDFRLGLAVQHNNLFERGHLLSAQYVTSPGHWSDVEVYGLNYKIPFPNFDSFLEMAYSDSNVNAGNLSFGASSVSVQGAGTNYAMRWTLLLDRLAGFDQRLTFSHEKKQFVSQVQLNGTGQSLVPELESRPTGLTYSVSDAVESTQRNLQLGYFKNYESGSKNSTAQYSQINPMSRADFDLFKFNASWSEQVWSDWRLVAQMDGQYSADSLISGEQFGAGGVYSVRGFEERVISADSGMRQSLELTGPNLSDRLGKVFERIQLAGFLDAAQLRVNNPQFGAASDPHIAAYGIGVRFAFVPRQQIRLDLAKVISGVPIQPHGDVMLHFTFATAL